MKILTSTSASRILLTTSFNLDYEILTILASFLANQEIPSFKPRTVNHLTICFLEALLTFYFIQLLI